MQLEKAIAAASSKAGKKPRDAKHLPNQLDKSSLIKTSMTATGLSKRSSQGRNKSREGISK